MPYSKQKVDHHSAFFLWLPIYTYRLISTLGFRILVSLLSCRWDSYVIADISQHTRLRLKWDYTALVLDNRWLIYSLISNTRRCFIYIPAMPLFYFTIMLYLSAVLSILVSEKPPRIFTIFFGGIFLVPNSFCCLDIVHPVSHSKWQWKLKLFSNMCGFYTNLCNCNLDVISVFLFCYNAVWGVTQMHVLPAFFLRLRSTMKKPWLQHLSRWGNQLCCLLTHVILSNSWQ